MLTMATTIGRTMQGRTQAFIVRVWYEETDCEGSGLVRRGSIEHVCSKKRIFFQDQAEMLKFIDEQMGVGSSAESHKAQGSVRRSCA